MTGNQNHADTGDNDETDVKVLPREETETQEPIQFKVVLLNDDYTPMDFVVFVLKSVFKRAHEEAMEIMMTVHTAGKGVAGVYSFEIAETKMHQVIELARGQKYPLQCVLEEV